MAVNNITVDNEIELDNNLWIYAVNGNVYIPSQIETSGTNFGVYAGKDVELDGGVIITNGGDLTINADKNADNDGIFSFDGFISTALLEPDVSGGDINITASDIELDGLADTINAGSGTVYISPSNNTESIGLGTETGNLTLTTEELKQIGTAYMVKISGDNISVDDLNLTGENWILGLSGKNGVSGVTNDIPDVQIENFVVSAESGNINLNTEVSNLQAETTTSGDITITNAGELNLEDILGKGYSVSGAGNTTIIATSPLDVEADVISTGDITLTASDSAATGDNLTLNANVTSTGTGTITLNAGDDIIQNSGVVSVTGTGGGTINISADTEGALDIDRGSVVLAGSVNSNGGDININAYEDIVINDVNAIAGTVTATSSAGAIKEYIPDDVADVIAGDLNLSAVTGIDLDTNINTLTASVSGTGDITIDEVDGIDLESVSTGDGDIAITAKGGDIILSGLVRGNNGSVYLYALGGSIIDNNTTGYDIIADKTSELYAGNGTIGIEQGANWFDPLEVNITGDLYVYASDENHLVSIGIDGIVQPRDVLLCYPNLTPPGLILFNGRMNGGMRSNQWFRAVSPSIQYIGVEKGVYSDILLQLIQDKYFQPEESYWEMGPDVVMK